MAKIETVSCDNCGKLKGENNHWWSIEANVRNKSMFIQPYVGQYGYAANNIAMVACGLECLAILESKIKEGKNPLK
jgi:hypothetical protein